MPKAQVDALRVMLANRPQVGDDLEARRRGLEAMAARFPPPPGVTPRPMAIPARPPVPATLFTPDGDHDADRLILYIHGGAFVVGSSRSHAALTGRLALAAGCPVLSLDQRLAPENPFPAALDDCVAAARWAMEHRVAPRHLALAGDSSGGNLALATLLRLKAAGGPVPGAVALISPYLDLTHSGASIRDRAHRDPFIDTSKMDTTAALYLGGNATPDDPLASPLFADLGGLPPLFVQVGEEEVLYDDAARLVARARAAGVDATLDAWADMIHVFPWFAGMIDEGAEAIGQMGAWLRAKIG